MSKLKEQVEQFLSSCLMDCEGVSTYSLHDFALKLQREARNTALEEAADTIWSAEDAHKIRALKTV